MWLIQQKAKASVTYLKHCTCLKRETPKCNACVKALNKMFHIGPSLDFTVE